MLHKYQLPYLSGVTAKWIGHMNRNCLLINVNEIKTGERIEVMGWRGRSKQILDIEERKGKERILEMERWSTGSQCGKLAFVEPVVRQTTEEMNESRTTSGSGQQQNHEENRMRVCFRRVTEPSFPSSFFKKKFSVHHAACTYSSKATRWSVHTAQVASQLYALVYSVSPSQNGLWITFLSEKDQLEKARNVFRNVPLVQCETDPNHIICTTRPRLVGQGQGQAPKSPAACLCSTLWCNYGLNHEYTDNLNLRVRFNTARHWTLSCVARVDTHSQHVSKIHFNTTS